MATVDYAVAINMNRQACREIAIAGERVANSGLGSIDEGPTIPRGSDAAWELRFLKAILLDHDVELGEEEAGFLDQIQRGIGDVLEKIAEEQGVLWGRHQEYMRNNPGRVQNLENPDSRYTVLKKIHGRLSAKLGILVGIKDRIERRLNPTSRPVERIATIRDMLMHDARILGPTIFSSSRVWGMVGDNVKVDGHVVRASKYHGAGSIMKRIYEHREDTATHLKRLAIGEEPMPVRGKASTDNGDYVLIEANTGHPIELTIEQRNEAEWGDLLNLEVSHDCRKVYERLLVARDSAIDKIRANAELGRETVLVDIPSGSGDFFIAVIKELLNSEPSLIRNLIGIGIDIDEDSVAIANRQLRSLIDEVPLLHADPTLAARISFQMGNLMSRKLLGEIQDKTSALREEYFGSDMRGVDFLLNSGFFDYEGIFFSSRNAPLLLAGMSSALATDGELLTFALDAESYREELSRVLQRASAIHHQSDSKGKPIDCLQSIVDAARGAYDASPESVQHHVALGQRQTEGWILNPPTRSKFTDWCEYAARMSGDKTRHEVGDLISTLSGKPVSGMMQVRVRKDASRLAGRTS